MLRWFAEGQKLTCLGLAGKAIESIKGYTGFCGRLYPAPSLEECVFVVESEAAQR
jgi:hypothetical protein